jgi:hypothetical protein
MSGIRVKSADDKGFAKAVRQLVCDGKLRERLGARGRSIAASYLGVNPFLRNGNLIKKDLPD